MRLLFSALPFLLLSSACTYTGNQMANAPIVLGDSATIVTETDSQYLKSAFTDFEATLPAEKPLPATETPKTDTTGAATEDSPSATAKKQNGPGLSTDFGDVEVFIQNLRVRNKDAKTKGENTVAYSSDGSTFRPKNLLVNSEGAKQISLKQKTDFELMLNTGDDLLSLSSLGKQSTGWQGISGNNGTFEIPLAESPDFKVSNAAIKNAAQQAARKSKMSPKEQTALLSRLSRVKSVDGDILQPKAIATMWQVTVVDAKGKTVTKEIRVDW